MDFFNSKKPQEQKPGNSNDPKNKSPMTGIPSWCWFLLIGLLIYLIFFTKKTPKISTVELESLIQQKQVQQLNFSPETLKIDAVVKAEEEGKKPQVLRTRATSQGHLDEIRKLAEKHDIKCTVANPPSNWTGALFFIIPLLVIFWIFSRMLSPGGMGGKGGFGDRFGNFSKSPAKQFKHNSIDRKTFVDVAGCDEAKEELQEIVEFLKAPEKFTGLGARVPKGVLLYGPPGTGKTLLARAVAGEANVPFLFANGAGFVEMFVGVGAARVRSLFEEAKKNVPCIIFIDEIEALGKQRGFAIGGGHDEREQALNELLSQMDGFEADTRVIVMAATNRPDIVDSALTRPGRFDRHVNVPKPDLAGREAILQVHTKKVKLNANINLKDIAQGTVGMSGADLENVVNEAALLATRRNRKSIEQADFSDAIDKTTMGPERRATRLSEKEKKTIAYHEAGHALVASLNSDADPVHKITIIPRGPALGYVKQLPTEDRHLALKKQLLAQVAVCLGGRAAEELVLEDISSGASNDLENANLILKKMICEWGMNTEVGLATYKGSHDFWGKDTGADVSEKTKEVLEQEIKKSLKEIYKLIIELFKENRGKLDALAKALLERETLTAEEVKQVIE